jgi:hypothetical protein
MIVSHTHKFIFVKSLKTAGTSLEAALSRYCSGDDIVTPLGDYRFNRDESGDRVHQAMNDSGFNQHDDAATIKSKLPAEVWDNYFKFSITRNPWDRAVSLFFWEYRRDPALVPRKRFYHYLGVPYDEAGELRKRLGTFVRGDWQNNDRFYIMDDRLCVDYVIKYESLEEDFRRVCREVGVPETALPRLKTGLRRQGHHYSELFDDESRAIVADRHQNDIAHFGYVFERG